MKGSVTETEAERMVDGFLNTSRHQTYESFQTGVQNLLRFLEDSKKVAEFRARGDTSSPEYLKLIGGIASAIPPEEAEGASDTLAPLAGGGTSGPKVRTFNFKTKKIE